MTGYLYQGSPLFERLNAQIREWRAACHGDDGPHGKGRCTSPVWSERARLRPVPAKGGGGK